MRMEAASRNAARFRLGVRWMSLGLAAGLAVLIAACTPIYRDHGYAPTDAELSAVKVGRDTRETVTASVGRPSASGVLSDDRWYYVQSRYRQRGARAPQEIDRQVVVISFNADKVSNVERFGLADGKVVALSRRVTESNIKGVTFLGQLFGNFGRLSAEQLLKQ